MRCAGFQAPDHRACVCASAPARPRCGVARTDAKWVASLVLAAAAIAGDGCGVRTPARIDVDALIATRGRDDARHELAVRVVADPKDVAARLGLAVIEERAGRPSGAIEQLEAVAALSGPIGIRWHADDRARLARLIAARGRARLAREASTALVDLRRARELGAAIDARELVRARVIAAIARLRHVDAKERAAAERELASVWTAGGAEPAWAGTRSGATPAERAAFGVWAWKAGAKRAAWEALQAWHDATTSPRDPAFTAAYLMARAWWIPPDGPPPDPEDLVGPDRCRYERACTASVAVASDEATRDALLLAPATPGIPDTDVPAWMAITLEHALRGEGSWGPSLAAHVDLAAVSIARLPGWARPAFAVLAGRPPVAESGELPRAPSERLVVAAGRALRGGSLDSVTAPLRDPDTDPALTATLLRVVRVDSAPIDHAFVAALIATARARVPSGPAAAALRRVAAAYARDPAAADRVGRDVVAEAVDASTAWAALGAMFDAIGDPARAREAWQAAVDASPELANVRGLAGAMARANDPDASLITTTTAAAASGDPAVDWLRISRALERAGAHVHALEAARNAIGLGSGRTLLDAYDVAIDASQSLGRARQVVELTVARARLAPAPLVRPADPTDVAAALAAHRRAPTAATTARLWIASRWNPRSVDVRAALLGAIGADDPRRPAIVRELVALAGDRDPEVGREAAAVLR